MLAAIDEGADLSSLRLAVSAGETLSAPIYEAWTKRTGVPILDGIGSTEMLHIFIGCRPDDRKPGVTGKPVPGYEARIVDKDFNDVPRGAVGRLAVRGPTGCRYLADARQREYVQNGWNVTGDAFSPGRRRVFPFRRALGRHDHIRRLQHRGPRGRGGAADPRSGRRMRGDRRSRRGSGADRRGFRRAEAGRRADDATVLALQNHAKATIAPYKYPRAVRFLNALPKTQTGKIQRFQLRSHQ